LLGKDEGEYQPTVVRLLSDVREDGTIPFDWIADNTRWQRKPSTFTGLSHFLQSGAALYGGTGGCEARSMLDLLTVGLECAMVVTAGTRTYKPVARFAKPALMAAVLWSAGLNAFAFSAAYGDDRRSGDPRRQHPRPDLRRYAGLGCPHHREQEGCLMTAPLRR
jgi:hypothetical protein